MLHFHIGLRFLLALGGLAFVSPDGAFQPARIGDIKVVLRFSVAELDPKDPGESFVECVVHNRTNLPLQVPGTYVGGFQDQVMALHGEDLQLVRWAGEKQARFLRVEAGKEQTVFKALLKDVLLLDSPLKKPLKPAEPRWYWSWQK